MATTDFERNGQIIQYLCGLQAYVVSCCCEYPVIVGNEQNPDGAGSTLLAGLAAAYPTTDWTDVNVLITLLLNGAKRGLYKRNVVGGNTSWYINLFLIRATPANKAYMPYCTALKQCEFLPQGHPIV